MRAIYQINTPYSIIIIIINTKDFFEEEEVEKIKIVQAKANATMSWEGGRWRDRERMKESDQI